MSRGRGQLQVFVALLLAAGAIRSFAAAQPAGVAASPQTTNSSHPPAAVSPRAGSASLPAESNVVSASSSNPGAARSPVDLFRQLLEAEGDELERLLEGRSPENQKRLMEKVREYAALPPEERELRLRATELRWYVLPLLSLPASNQQARLAHVPPELRKPVEERLVLWNLLPPPLQKEILESEQTLDLYFQLESSTPAQKEALLRGFPKARRAEVEAGFAKWQAMSPRERKETLDRANQFFNLMPQEREEVLGTLSETERRQMEKTLRAFEQLPADQRERCIRAFGKFASLSPEQRQQFLRNAERWKAMTPAERQAWRDLVRMMPIWPPEPPEMSEWPPIPPPPLPQEFVQPATTNKN